MGGTVDGFTEAALTATSNRGPRTDLWGMPLEINAKSDFYPINDIGFLVVNTFPKANYFYA